MTLLSIKGLRVEYPGRKGSFVAATGVNLTVERGEILGLVGESGAGKSTIGSAIMGLLDAPGLVTAGEILFEGQKVDATNKAALRALRGRRISMIFQDPLTSLNPIYTIGRQLVETIQTHLPLDGSAARQRAIEMLEAVGIAEPHERIDQYPHQFSGGMRQRVVIALVLCSEPDLIIADEPTTALDVSVQAQILTLIKQLVAERNVGVILVTHDMGVIAETADRVVVMHRGKVVETGTTEQVIHAPRHEYAKSLIAAVPRGDRSLHRFPRVVYQTETPDRQIDLGSHWLGRGTAATSASADAPALVDVKNLDLRFLTRNALLPRNRRYFSAVKDVSFQIREREVLGLVGESGSGKSTIARVLAQIYRPTSGVFTFNGSPVDARLAGRDAMAIRTQIQMIFQDPYSSLNPRMRVDRIIAEPIRHHKLAKDETELRGIVHDLLDVVGLGSAAAGKFPHEFSGGQRQRIAIARALATRPRFLICDEPTSALDVSIQAQILNLLKDLRDALNLTVLFISHDLPVVRQMCDRVIVMKGGAIVEEAEVNTLFNAPKSAYARELLSLMPSLERHEATVSEN